MSVDTLDRPVMVVASVGAPFEIQSPPELIEHVERVAQFFATAGASR